MFVGFDLDLLRIVAHMLSEVAHMLSELTYVEDLLISLWDLDIFILEGFICLFISIVNLF